MRNLIIVVLIAVAGYFGWKKYKADQPPEPAAVADPTKTPGANAAGRIDNLSGSVPTP